MRFVIALVVSFALVWLCAKPLKKYPVPFYLGAVALLGLYFWGSATGVRNEAWSYFQPLMQRCALAFLLFSIVMFVGVLVALLDAELAGILQRYYADFSFMFLAAAVLLCFVVNEQLAERAALHDLMLKLLLVLVGVSVAYSALLCLAPETGWYSDVYPWAYQGLLDAVVFWR